MGVYVYIKVYIDVYVIYVYLQYMLRMTCSQFQTFPEEVDNFIALFRALTIVRCTTLLSDGLETGLLTASGR